jgi:5,10-methylenetetrahydrofolate reductase
MSALSRKIGAGEFVVTTELTPPKGVDLAEVYAKAATLQTCVDAINITDSPRARMAIEPTAVARLLLERGVEPIVQFTSRDRNRIALQSDLLGAAALGVENVLFMAGDSPEHGDHPDAKAVFDLTSSQMLSAARALTEGRDLAGNPLKGAPTLFLGATANPAAADFDAELANTHRKIAAGAQFLQTQALYDTTALERLTQALAPARAAILVGVIPLKSAKSAAWLNANVPGICVPDALIAEMQSVAGDAEAERRTSLDIAARIVRSVQPLCAGVHLMMMGWENEIPELLRSAGIAVGQPGKAGS